MQRDLKVAVIGAGAIADDHLKCLRSFSNVELVGIANRSGHNLHHYAEKYGIRSAYTDWQVMLDRTSPDAVWIITSIESLPGISEEVISRGHHCFIEKPVSLYSGDIKKLADLADQKKVKAMVGFNRRFYYPILQSWLLSKTAGSLCGMHIEVNEDLCRVKEKGRHSPNVIDRWVVANSIHLIDLLDLFGGSVDVQNIIRTRHDNSDGMSFHLHAYMRGGQAIGSIRGDWASPRSNSINIRLEDMLINYNGLTKAEIICKNSGSNFIMPDRYDRQFKMGFWRQTDYFIKALLDDYDIGEPAANLWSCYNSVRVAEKILEG
jgi:predicted dehydrogenase